MKMFIRLFVLISAFASLAFAKDITPPIEVTQAKIFAPMKGASVTAGYAVIKNLSVKEVVLKVTKADPFKAVETHETKEKSGKMAMEKVASFKIPSLGSLELKPGGNHIMLFDATRDVKAGETILIRLDVDGKPVDIPFKVESRN